MEAVGLAIGVVSIASWFQTCLHGYRSLNVAMGIDNAALTLNIQFRVEEIRLYLWGRNWGLVGELGNGEVQDSSASNSNDAESLHHSRGSQDTRTSRSHLEILGRISTGLEEWRTVGERYGAAPSRGPTKTSTAAASISKESSTRWVSEISVKQAKQEKDISDTNRMKAKLRWAMKDKPALGELLGKLTNLNDSLEKLLPRREQISLARGLTGEILNMLEGGARGNLGLNIDDQLNYFQGIDAAKIIVLKRFNQTQQPEVKKIVEGDSAVAVGPTPFSNSTAWTKGIPGDMEIPREHILRLTEPKLQYHEQSSYGPLPRSVALFSPIATAKSVSEHPAQAVLVEWRPADAESESSELTPEDLKDRRDHIARLLHRTSTTDAEFCVLDCLGYTLGSGHTPDGSTHDLVGYVYRYPDFASPRSLPVTLREFLGTAYESDDPVVPSLNERFKLAQRTAIALYQLQCAGWIHRKISSYNVVFFRDRASNEVNFECPFLVGWQYARPDDQRRLHGSENSREGVGDLDMYVHRDRLLGTHYRSVRFPRFRKSYDIYSLGIILVEIAFWEPIVALASESDREKMLKFEKVKSGDHGEEWWTAISKTAKREIAPEMGIAYRDAVLFCLEGYAPITKKYDDDNKNYMLGKLKDTKSYLEDSDFEQIGLEKEFYWKVLNALDRFKI